MNDLQGLFLGASAAVLLVASLRILLIYWKARVLRSLLYLGIGGGLAGLSWFLRVGPKWETMSGILQWLGVGFFALGVGRAATLESGLYSTMRKRTRWFTLLFGGPPTFLVEEREGIDPPSTKARAVSAGTLLIAVSLLMALLVGGSPYPGLPFVVPGVAIVVYALIYLGEARPPSGGGRGRADGHHQPAEP